MLVFIKAMDIMLHFCINKTMQYFQNICNQFRICYNNVSLLVYDVFPQKSIMIKLYFLNLH